MSNVPIIVTSRFIQVYTRSSKFIIQLRSHASVNTAASRALKKVTTLAKNIHSAYNLISRKSQRELGQSFPPFQSEFSVATEILNLFFYL